jgi:short-subunit dehydrogenase
MVKRGNGKIMNVASIAGFQPGPLMAVYFATKAYVLHFSEALANEVKNRGVSVTALCPGPTISGFESNAGMRASVLFRGKKLPSSKEVAQYGYDSMMKGKVVAVHGWKNRLLINLSRLAPRSLVVKMARKNINPN